MKIHILLARRGVEVPYRTLHRWAVANAGYGRRQATVRVADGEPGVECQVDFGRMGLISDPPTGRRRVTHALIFTACYSRHNFVYLTYRQTIEAVIEGFEAVWAFFGGVFSVVVPDNMAPIVVVADATEPRFTDAFLEYSQSRGFQVDAARERTPTDKPRVERQVPYVRRNFFAGEDFIDLADGQRQAEQWCRVTAGQRVHGTTQLHPAEVFAVEEAPRLLPAPEGPYDLPSYPVPKVHRDRHIEVHKALYSVPGELVGQRVKVRADSKLIKIFCRGELIKITLGGRPAAATPTHPTYRARRPPMPCMTSTTCGAWLPTKEPRSESMPIRYWAARCRGPRCARSIACWAWSRSGGPSGSMRPAPRRWRPRRSTSG